MLFRDATKKIPPFGKDSDYKSNVISIKQST